jgi:hypothetical protein
LYFQIWRPVRASIAQALLSMPVTYSTLSRMSDVVSKPLPTTSVWNVHWGTRRVTFAGVICVSGLCR